MSGDARRDPEGSRGERARRARWWLALTLAVAAVALAAADLARPPSRQVSGRVLSAAITGYQRAISPALDRLGVRCRFSPTCSRYADACVRRFGAGRGGWLALKRLLRCGPWTPAGTFDPPPIALAPEPSSQ